MTSSFVLWECCTYSREIPLIYSFWYWLFWVKISERCPYLFGLGTFSGITHVLFAKKRSKFNIILKDLLNCCWYSPFDMCFTLIWLFMSNWGKGGQHILGTSDLVRLGPRVHCTHYIFAHLLYICLYLCKYQVRKNRQDKPEKNRTKSRDKSGI